MRTDSNLAEALEFYLAVHAAPELSGAERHTAARFAAVVKQAEFEVTQGIGGHGVVGVLRNGDGPTVALRAELDALPIQEDTGLPYASTVRAPGPNGTETPVMHACGHDLHLAALTGTAAELAERRSEWTGTVLLFAQPAEETLAGAQAMLADGLYQRFPKPDVVLAQHVAPLPAGMVAHCVGPATSACAELEVTVHGRGGHAASPDQSGNPIHIAAAVVVELATVVTPDLIITPGLLHAGVQANVVPETAVLGLSVRTPTKSRLTVAITDIAELLRVVSNRAGLPRDPSIRVVSTVPAQVNDAAVGELVRSAHESAFGPERVFTWPPSTASDDFAWYGEEGQVPTVYWMTGCVHLEQWRRAEAAPAAERHALLPPNHSPRFAPAAVPALRTAVTGLTSAALACLHR